MVAFLFWVQEVVGSNPATLTHLFVFHLFTHFQDENVALFLRDTRTNHKSRSSPIKRHVEVVFKRRWFVSFVTTAWRLVFHVASCLSH